MLGKISKKELFTLYSNWEPKVLIIDLVNRGLIELIELFYSAKELAAMHPESGSDSEEEFTLLRADSIQTSDTEECEELLMPEGSASIRMYDMQNGGSKK